MAQRPKTLLTDDVTSLTEFGIITPDKPPPTSGFLLSRLFRKVKPDGNDDVPEEPKNISTEPPPAKREDVKILLNNESPKSSDGADCIDPQVVFSSRDVAYTRSLTNVLKRVRNILDRRSSTPQAYKDSDFKQYWMPDSNCKECYECGDKFNTFRRRHHCRVCGQIFCKRCCNQEIPGKIMGYTGDLRACTYCCKVVLSYIQSSDLLPSGDLKALQEDLNACLSDIDCQLDSSNSIYESSNHSIRHSGSFRRKISTRFREEDFVKTSSRSDLRTFPSTPDMQISSERKLLTTDSVQLRDLWTQMEHPIHGVDFQNHRYLLKTFANCVPGCEIVDWLTSKDKVTSRCQATAIGQAFVDAGILIVIGRPDNIFLDDYVMYKACGTDGQACNKGIDDYCDAGQEPSWVKEIIPDEDMSERDSDGSQEVVNLNDNINGINADVESSIPRSYSTFYLDLNLQNSTASVKKASPSVRFPSEIPSQKPSVPSSSDCFNSEHLHSILPQSDESNTEINDDFLKDALFVNQKGSRVKDVYVAPQGWSPNQNLRDENGEKLAFDRLQRSFEVHRQSLIRQLLSTEVLSLNWQDTILAIVETVVEMVKPDVMNDNDDKDIRKYVHIKRVPGGNKSDCQIASGVVATKNILHRKMKAYLENPKILLVSSSIVYQRVENKLSSLEPIIMQENEYLKNVVAKICSYKPDIIMVEKTVSRCAQDMLFEQGITVVLNVKRSVIERIARCCQADIVNSLDTQLGTPHLGVCHKFWVHNYSTSQGQVKTLMGFDGCPKHLGCTVLLRGASNAELSKVKQIVRYLIYVEYNWHLERSFLMDEFAMPPALPQETSLTLSENDFTDSEDDLFRDDSNEDILESSRGKTSKFKIIPRNKQSRKSENEENTSKQDLMKMSTRLSIEEHSDPLRSGPAPETKASKSRKRSRMEVSPLPLSNIFRKALHDVVLSCSPNMKFPIPFLETEAGRVCELRKFFPKELYWSSQFHRDSSTNQVKIMESDSITGHFKRKNDTRLPDNIEIQPMHPFVSAKLTDSVDEASVQSLLANFRACGGQIKRLCPHEVANKKREKKAKNEEMNDSIVSQNSGQMAPSSNIYWEKKMDSLDVYKHQRLPVLFCSYSYSSKNAPSFCVDPWVVSMDFYGKNDITLGEFLERYCFRQSYECPSESCETSMNEHIRKFVHENGCIHIVLKKLEQPIPMAQSVILMWSWCGKCKQVTPFAPLSIDAWSMSFAKYLDLRFNGAIYGRRAAPSSCSHILHHDFYQYFGYKDVVASFKYSKIELLEVAIPHIVVQMNDECANSAAIIKEVKNLTIEGYNIYSCVLEKLCTLRETCFGSIHEVTIQNLLSQLTDERNVLRERIGEIQSKLTSPHFDEKSFLSDDSNNSLKDSSDIWYEITDLTCYLKQMIFDAVNTWNTRIEDFINMKRRDDKVMRKQVLSVSSQGSLNSSETFLSAPSVSNMSQDTDDPSSEPNSAEVLSHQTDVFTLSYELNPDKSTPKAKSVLADNADEVDGFIGAAKLNKLTDEKPILATSSPKFHRKTLSLNGDVLSGPRLDDDLSKCADLVHDQKEEVKLDDVDGLVAQHDGKQHLETENSNTNLELAQTSEECRKTIEALDRLQEEEIRRRTSSADVHREQSTSSSVSSVTICESVGMYIGNVGPDDAPAESFTVLHRHHLNEIADDGCKETRSHGRSKSDGDKSVSSSITTESDGDASKIPQSSTTPFIKVTPIQSSDRERKMGGTMKNLINQFLSSPLSSPVQCPFPVTEHFLINVPEPGHDVKEQNIPVILYDDEPSSVIAYTLASADYDVLLQDLVAQLIMAQQKDLHPSPNSHRKNNPKEDVQKRPSTSSSLEYSQSPSRKGGMLTFSKSLSERSNLEAFNYIHYNAMRQDSNDLDEDPGSMDLNAALTNSHESNKSKLPNHHIEIQFNDSSTNFYCKVYFAEQFRMLRKLIFPSGEQKYIRSLARCRQWKAHGGKSGSMFCMTHDKRFILKQMSKLEVQSFVGSAANYFKYIHRAANEQRPTVLAKIFGIYHIVYKNIQTNNTLKLHLLVMENLFYGRKIKRKFDLKGSERNRLVNTAGKEESELVLLDENLRKMTCDCPLYIKPHTKTILTLAIQNDSDFLSSQLVMDYSLLVGIDEDKKELVVGIIDYIRTFTWDKKIEMVVKAFGNQGKMPTVVSPELYRTRFCDAMDRYFVMVPDRWHGFGKGLHT